MEIIDAKKYIREDIQTLDLIGFRGTDVISKLITHLERKALKNKLIHISPKVSHVGLAVEGRDLLQYSKYLPANFTRNVERDKVYLFESTASGHIVDKVADVTGKYFFGAQVRPLDEVLDNYSGEMYHSGKLFQLTQKHRKQLVRFVNDYNHRPYERSPTVLFSNVIRCMRRRRKNTSSVFCSELVTLALQWCEYLPANVNPELVVPLDFYPDPTQPGKSLDVEQEIPLIFRPPIQLK